MAEIVEQIRGVLDPDAEADQILRKTTSSPGGGVDGGVPRIANVNVNGMSNLSDTHDITQGILIRLFTQPKLTLMPQRRVAATIRSLSSLSPVSKERTAP